MDKLSNTFHVWLLRAERSLSKRNSSWTVICVTRKFRTNWSPPPILYFFLNPNCFPRKEIMTSFKRTWFLVGSSSNSKQSSACCCQTAPLNNYHISISFVFSAEIFAIVCISGLLKTESMWHFVAFKGYMQVIEDSRANNAHGMTISGTWIVVSYVISGYSCFP